MIKKIAKSISITKVIAILVFSYIVFVSVYMISHRIWFSPDQFFVFALFGTVFIGRIKMFIQDWIPFVVFYLGYEFLRGLVPYVSHHVHIFPMIDIDKFIFGFIPTIKLQSLLYNPNHLMWYDYVSVVLYICHFVVPMVVGYFFWINDREFFKKYTFGFLAISYAAFITYIIFPAMPPWMAGNLGYIPPVREVISIVMSHFMQTSISLPSVFSLIGGDQVAAMPSLHAALPLMVFFYVYKFNKKLGIIFAPYVIGVWFAVIYLGEHYFIDVVVGIIYSTVIFLLIDKVFPKIISRLKPDPAIEV